MKFLLFAAVVCATWMLGGCSGTKTPAESTVTIAVEGDVDSFNPLFAEESVSNEINELLFPRLMNYEFEEATGRVIFTPYLAASWEFSPDRCTATFRLRTDASWSDGVRVTARDVQFSYELYGDTSVASVRQSVVQNLRMTNGRLDLRKAITVPNDSTVIFHFQNPSPFQLFDLSASVLPAHLFAAIPRNELRTHPINRNPVTCGPFALGQWTQMQEVSLAASDRFGMSYKPKLSRLVFKILPDYRARCAQLENGEVDVVSGLRVEDADLLSRNGHIRIVSTIGRDYDFIGWNNIDQQVWAKTNGVVLAPHHLFGTADVRRALTMAINREAIVKSYLRAHGRESIGGVSPLFQWAYNDSLKPLPYDKRQALALFAKEGWRDRDGDGVLEKGGDRFSFALKIAAGNHLRDAIAVVIQQQLREVKIEMKIEQVERATFWNDLMQRKYDAWFAGFSVPLQMQLDDLWSSDLKRYPFNLAGMRNARVDEILSRTKTLSGESDGALLWKEFQTIVQKEQPYTFLFWINNIIGINRRLQGTRIGVLGTTHKAWEWSINE